MKTQMNNNIKVHWTIRILITVLSLAVAVVVGLSVFVFRIFFMDSSVGRGESHSNTDKPHTPDYFEDPDRDVLYLADGFPAPFSYHDNPEHPR